MQRTDSTANDGIRCVVVGGAGFIGSHLVERLLDLGHTVDVIDDLSTGRMVHLSDARRSLDRRLKIHHLDVGDEVAPQLIRQLDPRVIFHLCGRPSEPKAEENPALALQATLSTLVVVLEAARACTSTKVIVGSSVAAGTTPRRGAGGPSNEDVVMLGLAHELAHRCLSRYRERFAVDFTDVRLTNVYGPRQGPDEGAVVPSAIDAVRRSSPPVMDGDGRQTRDFLYIDDAVDALCRSIERGGGLALEVGTGRQVAVRDLLSSVVSIMESEFEELAFAPQRPTEVGRRPCDPRRAELYLGWAPFTGLEDGLARTIAWWDEQSKEQQN